MIAIAFFSYIGYFYEVNFAFFDKPRLLFLIILSSFTSSHVVSYSVLSFYPSMSCLLPIISPWHSFLIFFILLGMRLKPRGDREDIFGRICVHCKNEFVYVARLASSWLTLSVLHSIIHSSSKSGWSRAIVAKQPLKIGIDNNTWNLGRRGNIQKFFISRLRNNRLGLYEELRTKFNSNVNAEYDK